MKSIVRLNKLYDKIAEPWRFMLAMTLIGAPFILLPKVVAIIFFMLLIAVRSIYFVAMVRNEKGDEQ